ncbi:MAG: MBL fold metallo-hydrolase [Bacteroidetes bacterium]|nr:MBL fold metallo-hydrolase [Bacteroidota bacterium]MCH8524053.1 MBL fold metallo-hydrolase [Balneolales bacterium]
MSYSRRDFLRLSSMLALATAVPTRHLFARETRLTPDNFTLLRRNVGIYSNRGGTIGWLVNQDGCVVVDSQFADTAADCLQGLEQLIASEVDGSSIAAGRQPAHSAQITDIMVDVLLNTHHHGDHTGGNGVFRPQTERIVAHENVPDLQRMQSQMRGGDSDNAYADTTFASEWSTQIGDETITAQHYGPAHTGGDAVIHFEQADIIHMGDLVFNGVYPFIDEGGGANIANWIVLLETVATKYTDETHYIFGHGQPSKGIIGSKEDVLNMRDYLSALLEHVQQSMQAGQSREEALSITTLAGFEDYVSFGPRLSLAANLDVAWNELEP